MQQGDFQHLAGQFSGSGEFRERAAGGAVELRKNAIDRFVLLERIGNQRIGLDFGQLAGCLL